MTKTFWGLWVSYVFYYFGKVNLSLVIPILLVTYKDLSLYNVGIVSGGFMLAYAAGQFIHGQISERYNPFTYIALGLIGSAIMNFLLGFTAGFFWLLLIGEILDGGFQSMGWSSIVRGNAETSKNPEKSSTILGTAYQFGNSATWLICAFAIGQWGWQWGFWIASIAMFSRGVTVYLTRKNMTVRPRALKERVKVTLGLQILLSGISLCLLNMVRFGVITWIPTYLFLTQAMPIQKVGINIFLIPIAGILGTLLYTKCNGKSDITTILYLIFLSVSLIILPFTSGTIMIALLLVGGFFLYGPHVFLVTTIPSRFQGEGVVAAATGFIDGWGYIGSTLIGVIVPFIIDRTGNWNNVFFFWASLALVVAFVVAFMYMREYREKSLYVCCR